MDELGRLYRQAYFAALKVLANTPCDPDIFPEQIEAWEELKKIKEKIDDFCER